MERRKHILSMLLLMATCLFSNSAFAQTVESVEVDGIYYNLFLRDKTAEVTINPNKYSGEINIPGKIIYNNVTFSVASIGDNAFDDCTWLTSIAIPNSITTIGKYAFRECYCLAAVIIPNSVTSIGYCAFYNCSGLTSVTIPNSITSIGDYAFRGCSGLTSVTIPNSVTSIGGSALAACSGLTSINVEAGNTVYDSRNNCNAIIETATNTLIIGCKNSTIPNSVTSIGSNAFINCSGLTSVTIPNSVTSIGSNAFWGCSGLTSVTLNSNAIVSTRHSKRSNMRSIFRDQVNTYIIGDDVTSIGEYAFWGCSGLTSVNIPNSVTSIGEYAFWDCSGLTSVNIPNSVISIGNYAFYNCSGFTSVTIPNSVTSIGGSAFYGCNGLTSVTIPNSVKSIGDKAFYGCSGLTSVNIGNSVESIEYGAFANCEELTDVYCYVEKVPSTNSDAYVDSYIEYATLHVPAASIEQYKTTTPWSDFGTIVPLTDEDAIAEVQAVPVLIQTQGNTINVEGAEAGTEIILYGTNGVQLDSVIATTGIASLSTSRLSGSVAIVKIGNKTVKVLVKQ